MGAYDYVYSYDSPINYGGAKIIPQPPEIDHETKAKADYLLSQVTVLQNQLLREIEARKELQKVVEMLVADRLGLDAED